MIVMTKYCNDKVFCNYLFCVWYKIVKFSDIYVYIYVKIWLMVNHHEKNSVWNLVYHMMV